MNETLEQEKKTIIIIDASQLTDWDLCKQKYYLRYKQYILPIRKDRNLDIGDVLHEMLRVFYFLKRTGGISYDKIVDAAMRRGRYYVAKVSELSPEDIVFLFKIFQQYVWHYRSETWIPVYIEKPFAVKAFEDENYIFIAQGKVDLIIKIPGNPDYIIVDHKKRSRIKAESKWDHQKRLYSKFLGINTFIVNKIGFLKTEELEKKFRREPISYTVEETEEWYSEFVFKLKEMIAYDKLGMYPHNPTSCDKWAGCTYKIWCDKTPSMRASLLGQNFKIGNEWDVTKHMESTGVDYEAD